MYRKKLRKKKIIHIQKSDCDDNNTETLGLKIFQDMITKFFETKY